MCIGRVFFFLREKGIGSGRVSLPCVRFSSRVG